MEVLGGKEQGEGCCEQEGDDFHWVLQKMIFGAGDLLSEKNVINLIKIIFLFVCGLLSGGIEFLLCEIG